MTTAMCKEFTHTSTKKRRPWTRNLKTQLKRLLEKTCQFGRAWISWMRKVDLIHKDMYLIQ
jgi:hypothetical protein